MPLPDISVPKPPAVMHNMSMPPYDDRQTWEDDGLSGGTTQGHLRPPIRITVLWHPNLQRVGDVAFLAGGPAEIARHGLEFGPIDGDERRPLQTVMVSRTPLVVDVGSTTVSITDVGHSRIYVDGQRLEGSVEFTREHCEHHMVLIEINRRVLLGVHAARPVLPARSRHGMIGDSPAIRNLRLVVDRAALDDGAVLVQGETGSGKELVAHGIHRASRRHDSIFTPINCGQLRPERIVSTLFGHRKGAYTGATDEHLGAFRRTHHGTLFLDEIGELPPEAQPSLLRALDHGEVLPMGANRPVRVDTRVIAATDADLMARAADGSFRNALFYRLGVVVDVPPLRARPDDIPRLLVHQLRKELAGRGAEPRLEAGLEKGWPWIDARIVGDLVRQRWPGNVRELLHFARSLATHAAHVERVDEALIADLHVSRSAASTVNSTFSSRPVTRPSEAGRAAGTARIEHGAPFGRSGAGPQAAAEPEPSGLVGSDGRTYGRSEVLDLLRHNEWGIHRAARRSGIPKTSLGRYAKEALDIVPAQHIPDAALREAWDEAAGDVHRLAERLRVTPRSLRRRLRQLRINFAEVAARDRAASTDSSPSTSESE